MKEIVLAHPWMTLFISLCLIEGTVELINRFFRTRNIKHRGWPPEHCDADGDFKSKEE